MRSGSFQVNRQCLSVAWPSGLEDRFYDGHHRKIDGSTPSQASLLRPWIHNYICSVKSNKQQIEMKQNSSGKLTEQELSETGFILRVEPIAFS